jgi:site-specific recombinase XerD
MPFIFPILSPQTGGRLNDVKRPFTNLLEAAGIENFRFHDIRHHVASKLVMSGVSLYAVSRILGHGDMKMTQIYAHLAPGHLNEVMNRI